MSKVVCRSRLCKPAAEAAAEVIHLVPLLHGPARTLQSEISVIALDRVWRAFEMGFH